MKIVCSKLGGVADLRKFEYSRKAVTLVVIVLCHVGIHPQSEAHQQQQLTDAMIIKRQLSVIIIRLRA